MATTRFGHLDDFTLKNSKVGIGTSDPTEALEVIGGSRSQDIAVTGIATLTSYEGFQNKKTSYVDNIGINTGTSGTLSGEIVIGAGLTMSVGTGATTGQGTIECMKVYDTFTPPCGGTVNRPAAAQPGALYYNKDFRTIEYWDGSFWRQVDNTTTSGRAVFGQGNNPSYQTSYMTEYIPSISTLGNAIDFGFLPIGRTTPSGCSNSTRGLFMGGRSGPSYTNDITYVTLASTGDGQDFGNLTDNLAFSGGCASSTRGFHISASNPSGKVAAIDYVEIDTTGNALDFGDLTVARSQGGACSSPTRGILGGGSLSPGIASVIDYITMASKGNGKEFGDLTSIRKNVTAASNTTRGVFAGGEDAAIVSVMDYITITSTGNATDFGNLTEAKRYADGASTHTRAVWISGLNPGYSNIIEYITIASTGNASDFGDTVIPRAQGAAFSDSHGGLGGF